MTKRRKKYRAKAVLMDPLSLMRPMSDENVRGIMLSARTALADIERGRDPGPAEWRDLADALNVCETLVNMGKVAADPVLIGAMKDTAASMRDGARRYDEGKGLRLSGPGLVALRMILDVYEQCLQLLTEHEIATAVEETQRIIREIQRRNPQEVTQL